MQPHDPAHPDHEIHTSAVEELRGPDNTQNSCDPQELGQKGRESKDDLEVNGSDASAASRAPNVTTDREARMRIMGGLYSNRVVARHLFSDDPAPKSKGLFMFDQSPVLEWRIEVDGNEAGCIGFKSHLHMCHILSNAIVFNDPVDAKQQLEIIRHNITGERRNQRRFQRARPDFSDSANADHKAYEVFLGDLGEHCEMVLRAAMNSCSANPASSLPFSITRSGDAEDFQYLQDALEVPYWAFMVKEFGRWRQNVRSLTGPAVVRLLQSVRLELSVAIAELDKSDQAGPDDITPILNGIQARVRVLNDVSESNSQGLLDIEQDVLKCVCRRGHQRHESSVKTSISTATQKTPSLGPNRTSNVLGITVMFLFLLGAFVPGSKGFAICLSHPHAVGSTSDADFWYLLQSNIMWVLGSLLMIIFLRKDGLLSLAHLAMWLFLLTGLAFAVASVSIFTRVNTGWSNLLAFFATCSSIAAVLVAAQGSDQYHQGAANNDLSQKRKGE